MRGLLPKSVLDCLGDLEDTHGNYEAVFRWVERELDHAHVKATTGLRAKAHGIREVAPSGRPAPAYEPGGSGAVGPPPATELVPNALAIWLAAVAKGKGGTQRGKGKGVFLVW